MATNKVSLQGDVCTGHGCFPPRQNSSWSSSVYVNGLPVHRQYDDWSPHGCSNCPPHSSRLAMGSANVYVEGKQLGRQHDPVECGSKVQGPCSADVFAGDFGG